MSPEQSPPAKGSIDFDGWKLQLRRDCQSQDKLLAFNALSDSVLRLLWERGLDPSVRAIIGSVQALSPNPD
jgi:hypothetical protein